MNSGKRRPKFPRAQLRASDPVNIHQGRLARQRNRLAKLALLVVTVVLTTAIVHGYGPPFAYRIGQRAPRELRVNVEQFHRPNPVRTNVLRQAAAGRVPPIFVNDPSAVRELQKQLEDLIDAIAALERPTLEDLDENLVSNWSLDEKTFEDLRTASDSPERRDDLRRRIGEAFAPLIQRGVLAGNELPADVDPGIPLEIRTGDISHSVNRDLVLRERLSRIDMPAATKFVSEFLKPELGRTLFQLVSGRLSEMSTLRYEDEATQAARQVARSLVPEQKEPYARGDLLVPQGEPIQDHHLELLRLEHEFANAERSLEQRARRAGGIFVLVAALFALIGYYIQRHEPKVAASLPRIAVLCTLAICALGLARLLATTPWGAELIPIALAAMTLAVAYNPQFAVMATFGLALLTSLALGGGLGQLIVIMGGTAAGVLLLGEVRTRTKPIRVGAVAALSYFVLSWSVGLWQDQPLDLILFDSFCRAGWGLMTGFLLGGCLPYVERYFGIVTGISLLELGDVTHPLLQELVRRAPGTHNHSITVGTIAEAAAEKIGADALLVRVGAYFHDIGKMVKPHYFIENQAAGTANRHANLAPAMSTLIIIGHVKDGADLARQHKLPRPIIDLIEQHHGTTLVEYFFREATRRGEANPDSSGVQESSFRYPGPKPQSKEAAVLMVSDSVESASRTLDEPAPARLEGLVTELVDKRLRDGQFDECDLTLKEIATIRESLIKSLIGIYHGRVKYPEQRTA